MASSCCLYPEISGLYAVTPDEMDTPLLLAKVEAAIKGGVSWVQYRNKTACNKLRREQAEAMKVLTDHYQVPLIINDHPWLAIEIGAAGAHIGMDDGNLASLRERYPSPFILGASCYNRLDLCISAIESKADYIALGRFFTSTTKPGNVYADPALIRFIKSRLDIPIVGIGGICLSNAASLLESGLDAVAVVSCLFSLDDQEAIEARAKALTELFHGRPKPAQKLAKSIYPS